MTLENEAPVQAAQEAPAIESSQAETSSTPKIEATPRAALERAFKSVEEADKPQKQEAAAATEAPDRSRDERGRFANKEAAPSETQKPLEQSAPQEQQPTFDAPSRFTPDAKAAWESTPLPVKAEISRAFSEMETGLKQYQERFQALKPFEDIAKQANTTIESALTNYISLERDLHANPAQGLQKIFDYIGVSPRDWAASILGQPADQVSSQQESIIRDLKAQIQTLTEQVGTVHQTIEQQQTAALESQVNAWAQTKPRFEELRTTMASLMTSQMANTLDEAYEMAERLKPAPAQQAVPSAVQAQKTKPDFSAQTQKGQLSVRGAPSAGSNPDYRSPPKDAREALKRSFAQLGLS